MYMNYGKLEDSEMSVQDFSRPLVVKSCGTYHLQNDPPVETVRPNGRKDYQLLYIAAGTTHFFFDGKEKSVPSGSIILYRPGEYQKYIYYSEYQPEVFWVHFSGSNVEKILKYYHIDEKRNLFPAGQSSDYKVLFQKMILELQMLRPMYTEMLSALLNGVFLLICRQLLEADTRQFLVHSEIEQAISYFNTHYSEKISIDEYANKRHISKGWFIRSFKAYTGLTPLNYLLTLRLGNARELLEQTNYSIKKIAAIVGYDNPLYFSRLFAREYGISPSDYRQKHILPPPPSDNT